MRSLIIRVLLKLVASRSNNPTYKVGCIIRKGYRFYFGWNMIDTIHAEDMALSKVPDPSGAVMYCSWSPCKNCEKLIMDAGISRLRYGWKYPGNPRPLVGLPL